MRLVQLSRHWIASLPPEGAFVSLTACWHLGAILALRLLMAYQRGIFPWFSPGDPILWWSPRCPRGAMARITAYQPS